MLELAKKGRNQQKTTAISTKKLAAARAASNMHHQWAFGNCIEQDAMLIVRWLLDKKQLPQFHVCTPSFDEPMW